MSRIEFLTKAKAFKLAKEIDKSDIETVNGVTRTRVADVMCLGRAKYLVLEVNSITEDLSMETVYEVIYLGYKARGSSTEEALLNMLGIITSLL